jgi:hypothetical protein
MPLQSCSSKAVLNYKHSVVRRFVVNINKTTIDVLDSPDAVCRHPGWSLQNCLLALTARFASHLGTGHSCIRRFCPRFLNIFAAINANVSLPTDQHPSGHQSSPKIALQRLVNLTEPQELLLLTVLLKMWFISLIF